MEKPGPGSSPKKVVIIGFYQDIVLNWKNNIQVYLPYSFYNNNCEGG